jgi:hypothetical protein
MEDEGPASGAGAMASESLTARASTRMSAAVAPATRTARLAPSKPLSARDAHEFGTNAISTQKFTV